MKSTIFLGFAAMALSAAIEKRQPEAEPQVSGGLDGFVPGASGFLNGLVNGATAIGTLGGIAINPLATPTPAAKRDPQLLSGGLSGFVPDASGFLEGLVNGPTAAGTLGGIAINPLATPTPAIKERDPQLLSGGLSGFVPDASGFLEGLINGPTASGQLGGIAIDPLALETPAPSLDKRQDPIGGALSGLVSGLAGGFVSGNIIDGVPFGCVGGIIPGETVGGTVCGTAPAASST